MAPDDQKNSWYAWCCNQGFHALLGVIAALYVPGAPLRTALILGLLKEGLDLTRGYLEGKLDGAALVDSAQDTSFWVMGAFLISYHDHNVPASLFFMALLCGAIPRVRRALRWNYQ